MKTFILLFLLPALFIPQARSQIYIDILTAPSMTFGSALIRGQMDNTNDNLKAIKRGQLYLQSQLLVANDLQNKVLKGLREVSGTLNNAITIRQIYEKSADVVAEMQDVVQLAADNPQYSIFAYKSAGIFRDRALGLYAEIARILNEDDRNLLDAGERQQLLNKVLSDLNILYAAAYGIHFSMQNAIRKGFWQSLNPFHVWVNQDAQIMRNIIRNASYL